MNTKVIFVALAVLFLGIFFIAADSLALETDKWGAIRESDVAVVSSEWTEPVWLSEVNTTGWEDGAYISADGNNLYFTYINIDLLKLPRIVALGPNRDTAGVCNSACGQFPRSDLFYSTKDESGKWKTPLPHPLTVAYPIGGFFLVNENKGYFHMEKNDGLQTEIYFAQKINGEWQKPDKIPALSSKYKDDDPYVTPSDDELFFWSDRPAKFAGNNIYYSRNVKGVWQEPTILPEPINSNANDMQPFVFKDTLYFSSDRDGKPKIYKSVLQDEQWSTPEVVISSKNAVGEPTLTADGKFLYFIQIFVSDIVESNPEIMYVQRRKTFAQTSIKAEVDKTSITTDETLTYKIIITSSEKEILNPQLPKFAGFKVISQVQSSQISLGGSENKTVLTYQFILVPIDIGKFKLEPATVKIKNEVYSTDSFEIEVRPGKTKSKTQPEQKPSLPEEILPETEEPQITI